MCGIIACLLGDTNAHCAPLLIDGLTMLQHRGQDAAGIATRRPDGFLALRKDNGLVSEVFQKKDVRSLEGNIGIGHCRYPTAGCSSSSEAQPFYTNTPCGLCLAHNGSLTNTEELRRHLSLRGRHCNTTSDSEVLLNVFADALMSSLAGETFTPTPEKIFRAIEEVTQLCRGGYSVCILINNVGIVSFRDPNGIRPFAFGERESLTSPGSKDYMFASESVAIESNGFQLIGDLGAGEARFIDLQGKNVYTRQCSLGAVLTPCIFEYVYFARPDSFLDGVSVYQARLNMGEKLARKILRRYPNHDIDVVIPVPDTSRTSALQLSYILKLPYREGFIKNRYIARTFIMPGQQQRKKNVRKKLNPIRAEFYGKKVLLVDDSIVRGNTARQIVDMVRKCGAEKVYFASAAPAVRYPNVYGIDMPAANEYVAHKRNEVEIGKELGVDWLLYQDLEDLEAAIRSLNPTKLKAFDTSCFSGTYVTGDIDMAFLEKLALTRNDDAKSVSNGKLNVLGDSRNGAFSKDNNNNMNISNNSPINERKRNDEEEDKNDNNNNANNNNNNHDIGNGFGVQTPKRKKNEFRSSSPDQL
jgi:amidophosphoribosyltransferase